MDIILHPVAIFPANQRWWKYYGLASAARPVIGADLEKLLQTAKAHSVSAMVCMALEQTDTFRNAEESTRLKWIDAKNKAVRKNLLLDTERHQLEKEFAKNGIWYMPLKGSILKDW